MNFMRMHITIQFAEIMVKYPQLVIEGNNKFLAMYQKGKTIDIIEMDNYYEDGLELVDIILD